MLPRDRTGLVQLLPGAGVRAAERLRHVVAVARRAAHRLARVHALNAEVHLRVVQLGVQVDRQPVGQHPEALRGWAADDGHIWDIGEEKSDIVAI